MFSTAEHISLYHINYLFSPGRSKQWTNIKRSIWRHGVSSTSFIYSRSGRLGRKLVSNSLCPLKKKTHRRTGNAFLASAFGMANGICGISHIHMRSVIQYSLFSRRIRIIQQIAIRKIPIFFCFAKTKFKTSSGKLLRNVLCSFGFSYFFAGNHSHRPFVI